MEKVLQLQTAQLQQQTKIIKTIEDRSAESVRANTELNSNVIVLTDEIRKSVKAQREGTDRIVKTQKETAKVSSPAAREMSQKAGQGYNASLTEGLMDKFKDLKKLGSLEGWFDLSEGKNQGLVGQAVRRKVGENQFVKDQMEVNPQVRNMKQYKDLSDDEFKAKRETDLRAQYNRSQTTARAQRDNEARIKELTDKGYEEKDLARSGLLKRRASLDEQQAEANPAYRAERKRGMADATPVTGAEIIPFPGSSPAPLVGGEEQQSENLRLMNEQTEAIKKIEENTRPLGNLVQFLGKQPAAAGGGGGGGGGGDEGGGGLLDMASNFMGKGGMLGKAKTLGSSLIKNPSTLGKAGAVLSVAAGAYTAYQGWSQASEEQDQANAQVDAAVQSGQITPTEASTIKAKVEDTTNVKKGAAAGEGTGMAVGGIAGMKAGAVVGTMIGGPVGTVVGGAIGGVVGAVAGSSVGKKIGGSIVSGYQSVRDWWKGDEKEGKEGFGAKAGNFISENKGKFAAAALGPVGMLASTFMGDEKNPSLAQRVGGFVKEKVGYVKDELGRDLSGGVGKTQAEQMISTKSDMASKESTVGGKQVSTTTLNEGMKTEKSLFGSTTLGALFAKKDQEIGQFMASGSEEQMVDGKGTGKYGTILGQRKSGGFFGRDSYTATLEGKEGEAVYDEKFTKKQYMDLQKMSAEGKYDEAAAKFKEYKQANEEAAASVAGPASPEEVGQSQAKGMSLSDIWGKAKKAGGGLLGAVGSKLGGLFGGSPAASTPNAAALAAQSDRLGMMAAGETGPGGTAGAATKAFMANDAAMSKAFNDQAAPAAPSLGKRIAGFATGIAGFLTGSKSARANEGPDWSKAATIDSYNMGPMSARTAKDAQGRVIGSEMNATIGEGGVNIKQNAAGVQTRVGSGMFADADLVKNQDVLDRARAAAPTPTAADKVAGTSAGNMAAKEQKQVAAPVVINAPQNTSVQQTQNYAPKSPPRNTESSMQQYNRSRFAY